MSKDRLHHSEIVAGTRSVDLFEPEGPFDDDVVGAFRDSITELLARGRLDVRVGCGRITRLDSTALGVLIGAYTALRQHSGRLALDYQGNRRIRDLLLMCRLDEMLGYDPARDDPNGAPREGPER